MPYYKKPGAITRMYDKKGKPTGLMMEGSVNHMESVMQEKKNLMQDMPIDNRGVGEMSPYKMDHGDSAAKFTGMSGGSAMHKTDPEEEGVTVTGDASKIGGKTTMTEAEKKREALKKRIEARKISEANEKMERKMKTETLKAEIAKRRIAREQEKRKREGKDYIDPDGNVVRRS